MIQYSIIDPGPDAYLAHEKQEWDNVCRRDSEGFHDWYLYDGGGVFRGSWWGAGKKHYGRRCKACGYVDCEVCNMVGRVSFDAGA